MKSALRKSLSVLLTLTMVLSVFGGLHVLPAAQAVGNGKALQLTGSGEAANIPGAQASAVYFGNYKQSSDGGDGYNVDPVKWRVLGNLDGKLFLLADQNLDVVRYNEENTEVTWETCTLRKWLNGCDGNPYEDSFIGAAFSDKETAAIAETAVVNDDNPSHGTSGGSDTTDKVFLLSIAQATDTAYGFTDNYDVTDARVSRNTAYVASGGHTGGYMYAVGVADEWWLRSPGGGGSYSSVVFRDGFLNDDGDYVGDNYVAVRPAFNLNLNSVLFTSAAAGGKTGDGALTQIADYSGSDWKLTLLDESRAFAVTETAATAVSGGSVTLTYTGATTGDNEYVSAILADETGSAVYYGRLSQPEASGGAITVNLPALAAGSYTLKVFSEQYNGDYKTDYASAFSDVALTVISQLAADKAAFEAYKAEKKAAVEAMAEEGDSTDAQQIIAAATAAIEALTYDEAKTLDENKAAVDAAADIADRLAAQRATDLYAAKIEFDHYKAEQKAAVEAMAQEGDSEAVAQIIAAAAADIDALIYDEFYTLAENKATVDTLANIADRLAAQRAADAAAAQLAADKAAFDAYKFNLVAAVQAMAQDGDSEAAAEIIANAAAAIALLDYDTAKTLDENKAAVDALADIAGALDAQRAADAAAAQLADAKADAKAALANYKNAADYRAAEQAALAEAIAAGNDAIDNAADADAVAAALADAKAALDEIKTDADLTAEEAAAVKPKKKEKCAICGRIHTGRLFDYLEGELHWWLNVLWVFIRGFASLIIK